MSVLDNIKFMQCNSVHLQVISINVHIKVWGILSFVTYMIKAMNKVQRVCIVTIIIPFLEAILTKRFFHEDKDETLDKDHIVMWDYFCRE